MPEMERRADAKVAGREFRAAIQAIAIARLMLEQHRGQYDTLIEQNLRMDSIGFALDPTLYRQMLDSKNLGDRLRVVRAAVTFMDEVGAVMKEAEEKQACEPSLQPSR